MTAGKERRPFLLSSLFSQRTDFYALLTTQAAKTLEGVKALVVWIESGADEDAQHVRDLEREADELRLDLERKLVDCFITPFDREDIYDLSAMMDGIINAAKATVREVEAMQFSTTQPRMRELAGIIVDGTNCLYQSFENLGHDTRQASNQAFLARKCENRFGKVYRVTMKELFESDDCKTIMKAHEVYRCMSHAADQIDAVGEKLLHVIVKIS